MKTYAAFLGHQPSISLAELHAVVPDMKVLKLWTPVIITFQSEQILNQAWLRTMGGTVLIAEEAADHDSSFRGHLKKLNDVMPKLLHENMKAVRRKATFSFRCLGIPHGQIRTLYRICKQHLKDKGMASRYIGNERSPAKPGTLLLRGIPGDESCELVILHDQQSNMTWIGKTCAVQDIEEYTHRDMDKPFRDTKTGLLPPKLAQIMINLGLSLLPESRPEQLVLWDPFCGSGVIAIEAINRRIGVLASDKMQRAVTGCQENMLWIRQKEKTPKSIITQVWKADALKKQDLPHAPHLIVTETTLGPGMSNYPTKRDVVKLVRDGDSIEIGWLRMMKEMLPDLPIVCTFPVYITKDGQRHFLEKSMKSLDDCGYRIAVPKGTNIEYTDRHTLLYQRPDQFVAREIVCLIPSKKSASVAKTKTEKVQLPASRPVKTRPSSHTTSPRPSSPSINKSKHPKKKFDTKKRAVSGSKIQASRKNKSAPRKKNRRGR